MMDSVTSYIGLGSNLDDPHQHITQAIDELDQLPHTRLDALSSRYRTAPVGPADQPDFINAVVRLETTLEPLALLDALQAIENHHQRTRTQRWGPRTLDLDILFYADQQIDHARLTLPHPELSRRGFVLVPLLEIEPTLTLPDGQPLADFLDQLDCSDVKRETENSK